MKSNAKYLRSVVAIVGIAVGLILTMPMVLADTVEVVPLNSAKSETGKNYGEWSAVWWQYVFSISVHNPSRPRQILNPLFDEKGDRCGVDQPSSSPVFFLVGVVNVSGTATRTK